MKIGIIGIGNVMFGDEGVGVHLAGVLERSYRFTSPTADEITFIDGGTLAMALTPILASFDRLVIIDCISADDGVAGDVYFFEFERIPLNLRWDGSAHEVEMLQTLELMRLSGDLPPVHILGIVPTRVEPMSFELSPAIRRGARVGEKEIVKFLQSLGFSAQLIENLSVQDMADAYALRGLK